MLKTFLKHFYAFLAVFFFLGSFAHPIFYFGLAIVAIISISIGFKEKSSEKAYLFDSFWAGNLAIGVFASFSWVILFLATLLSGQSYLPEISLQNEIRQLPYLLTAYILIGPAILNSYRAYRDWRYPVLKQKRKAEQHSLRLAEKQQQRWNDSDWQYQAALEESEYLQK